MHLPRARSSGSIGTVLLLQGGKFSSLKSYHEDRGTTGFWFGPTLFRHPLTRCSTRSQVDISLFVPFDIRRAGQKPSPRCTLSLVHNCYTTFRLRKRPALRFRSDGCRHRGVAGCKVGNGRQGAPFFEIRGVMVCCQRRGRFQRMHEPPPLEHVS